MNFLSNLANSVPGVGHAKAVIHYAVGDTEGGNKAMYQSTRSAAVLTAGIAGSVAGPGGAVVASMYAGAITDGVVSVLTNKPQGFVKGVKNIAEDVQEGRNPMGSIASTGFQVGMDGLGGLGMGGGVSSAASQVSGNAIAKGAENIAKTAVKTVGEKAIEKTLKMTGEEVVKTVTKSVTKEAVKKVIQTAAVQAEIALVTTHVCIQADERTKEEEREERDREERDRKERQRRDRERREREERERREREERERREREERERHAREERQQQEQRAREQQEQRAREQQEQRAREQQEQRAREQQEQRAREQQEQRAREQQEQRAREQQEQRVREQLQQRFKKQVEQCSTPGSNSGSSQTPQGNGKDNKKSRKNEPNYFDIFENLLGEILDVIFGVERPRARIRISQIFQGLSNAQKDYLGKIIERLYIDGILVEVLILVIRIFSEHFFEDISFTNFLSLTEFVAVYIKEEINYQTVVFRMDEKISRRNDSSIPEEESENLRAAIVSSIMNLADIVSRIVDIFVRLRFDIETELMPFELPEIWSVTRNLSPNFRDVFSAIYHYFKHRCVNDDSVLSVREYYDWIRRVLEELGRDQDYRNLLQDTTVVKANVKFEMYVPIFKRRIRIIVNIHRKSGRLIIVLASCYVLDNEKDGDEEGMVWIYIRRL